jgi:hypothetical protein
MIARAQAFRLSSRLPRKPPTRFAAPRFSSLPALTSAGPRALGFLASAIWSTVLPLVERAAQADRNETRTAERTAELFSLWSRADEESAHAPQHRLSGAGFQAGVLTAAWPRLKGGEKAKSRPTGSGLRGMFGVLPYPSCPRFRRLFGVIPDAAAQPVVPPRSRGSRQPSADANTGRCSRPELSHPSGRLRV